MRKWLNNILNIPAVLLVIAGMFFSSCYYDKSFPVVSCDAKIPAVVSFENDVIPIFNASCNQSGCHNNITRAGKLNLSESAAYDQLSKPGSGYLDTLDAKSSLLYAQMNSTSTPMPPTGKLDQCSIQLILVWIQQGAKKN